MDTSEPSSAPVGASTGSGTSAAKVKRDIVLRTRTDQNQPQQQSGFFKAIKAKHPMFPFHEEKIRWDDYGNRLIIRG